MGIQFPPIAFLYRPTVLLFIYLFIYFYYVIVQWYKLINEKNFKPPNAQLLFIQSDQKFAVCCMFLVC